MRRVSPPYLGAAVTSVVVALVFPLALVRAAGPLPEPSWARQFGTDKFDQANGVAVRDFNVYVAGDAWGALPGQGVEFPNERSAFVRKYDRDGNIAWTHQFGGNTTGEDTVTGIATTANAVYVAGWTAGVLPGQSTLSDQHDAFVVKYDVNGAQQWMRQFGTESSVEALAVTADDSGVYVVGAVDCCGSPFPGTLGSTGADAFLRKYSPDGAVLWTRQFGSVDVDRATAVFVDVNGVYVAGTTNGEFAGPRGQQDGFIAKFDANGGELWRRQFGTTDSNEEVNAITVGASGVYVGGRTSGSLTDVGRPIVVSYTLMTRDASGNYTTTTTNYTFPGTTTTYAIQGLWDSFVMQFSDDGKLQWVRQFGGPGDGDNVYGLSLSLTRLMVTGAADGALPGQPFVGGVDAFYRLYDFTGGEQVTREFGNGLNDFGTSTAADGVAFYVAGTKEGAALGLTPLGDNDAFVMKMGLEPLDKEDVKLTAPSRAGGARGRAGRAGRSGN